MSKWKWQVDPFDIEDSMFSAIDYETHRIRRSPLNRFFSKAKVRSLQSRVDVVIDKLLDRITGFQQSGQPLRIDYAFGCLTNGMSLQNYRSYLIAPDIATEYAFGRSYNRLDSEDFDPKFQEGCVANVLNCHLMRHLPWLLNLMTNHLPSSILSRLDANFDSFLEMQEVSCVTYQR